MEIGWIMGGFMLFCIFIFIAVALLFPESVGITGKLAKKIQAEQEENKKS
jgi:hypothetical protein